MRFSFTRKVGVFVGGALAVGVEVAVGSWLPGDMATIRTADGNTCNFYCNEQPAEDDCLFRNNETKFKKCGAGANVHWKYWEKCIGLTLRLDNNDNFKFSDGRTATQQFGFMCCTEESCDDVRPSKVLFTQAIEDCHAQGKRLAKVEQYRNKKDQLETGTNYWVDEYNKSKICKDNTITVC